MIIRTMEVENFKNFKRRTFTFNERFTLLVGDNGTGKTSVYVYNIDNNAYTKERMEGGCSYIDKRTISYR